MRLLGLIAITLAFAAGLPAQTFTMLHGFEYATDGSAPKATPVLDGNTLYGTTTQGGIANQGTIFKVNTDGTGFAVVYTSGAPDWKIPNGLILSGGTLYGTTQNGNSGVGGWYGTVFKVNTDGNGYMVIKTFTGSDGRQPMGSLVLGGQTLYGTTEVGESWNQGTVFKVNTDGSDFAVLHQFPAVDGSYHNSDGDSPLAELILDGSTLFGTTSGAGTNGGGTVFRLNTDGSGYAVLHSFPALNNFTNAEGARSRTGLTLSGDTLYGTTSSGGAHGFGTVFKVGTNGSNFAVLLHLPGDPPANSLEDGPWSSLVLNGNTLYGTSPSDESTRLTGTIFKVNTNGSGFAKLHRFSMEQPNGTNWDGMIPQGGLVLGGNTLYGVAPNSGPYGGGTVFGLRLPCATCPPLISSVTQSNGALSFSWSASLASGYQVQYKTDAVATNWNNLGEVLVATNDTLSVSDAVGPDPQRFYRVVLLQP